MKKICGNNIELKLLERIDLDSIASAWDEFRYVPFDSYSKDLFFWKCNKTNEVFDWSSNSIPTTIHFCIFYENNAIGYTSFYIDFETGFVNFKFTIFKPEYRELNLYSELNILRHKFVYSFPEINKTTIRLLKNNPRQEGTLQSLYTVIDKEELNNIKGTFIHSHITRDIWEAWINDENQLSKLNQRFEVNEV